MGAGGWLRKKLVIHFRGFHLRRIGEAGKCVRIPVRPDGHDGSYLNEAGGHGNSRRAPLFLGLPPANPGQRGPLTTSTTFYGFNNLYGFNSRLRRRDIRRHEVGFRRAGSHEPSTATSAILGKAGTGLRCARHGDRSMRASAH